MKLRQGFISNSSSSSFIVGFKERPKNAEEMLEILFPHDGPDTVVSVYDDDPSYDDPDELTAGFIAGQVFDDLCSLQKLSKAEILEEINSGSYPGMPDTWNRPEDERLSAVNRQFREKYGQDAQWGNHKDWNEARLKVLGEIWAEENAELLEAAKKCLEDNWEWLKDREVFAFEYHDDSTAGSMLEHGDIFRNLPHIRVSHH
jgi:hypothetical protein